MKSPSEIVFRDFLIKNPPEKRSRLAKFLSEGEKARLNELPDLGKIISFEEFQEDVLLDSVHWSWLIPILKTYAPKEQKYFVTALSEPMADPLRKELALASPFPSLTPIATMYLRRLLENSLVVDQEFLMPPSYLPEAPLSRLLQLSKNQLIQLVNLLSLDDLASELRQIVETKILKKIYSFLTEEERKRVKALSMRKDLLPAAKLPLDRWDGTEESFRILLHRRGLARLSLGLAGQDPDLIWYVCHQFDIGRGTVLWKGCGHKKPDERSELVVGEIEELIRDYL